LAVYSLFPILPADLAQLFEQPAFTPRKQYAPALLFHFSTGFLAAIERNLLLLPQMFPVSVERSKFFAGNRVARQHKRFCLGPRALEPGESQVPARALSCQPAQCELFKFQLPLPPPQHSFQPE
jgi:hypothetical protein